MGEAIKSVLFLPGIIMPSGLRYGPLLKELGADIHALTKDLEVYTGPTTPPANYSLAQEVDGIDRAADAAGFDRFHLYGHSGGGACALAYVAAQPDRVVSLAVDEPAADFLGTEAWREWWLEFERAQSLPQSERLPAFLHLQLAPDVPLPPRPDGPPPEWMVNRPAGVEAFIAAGAKHHVDGSRYRAFDRPVYFSHGSLSHPHWQAMRVTLAGLFPFFTAELYSGLHHLSTSHQAEPGRVAAALHRHWRWAEERTAHATRSLVSNASVAP